MRKKKEPAGQNARLKERERFNDLLEKRKGIHPNHSLLAFYLYVRNSLPDYRIKIGNLGIAEQEKDGSIWTNNMQRVQGIVIEHPSSVSKTIIVPAIQSGIEIKAYSLSQELEDCLLEWGGLVFVSETCRTHNPKGLIRHRSSIDAKYVKLLEKRGLSS